LCWVTLSGLRVMVALPALCQSWRLQASQTHVMATLVLANVTPSPRVPQLPSVVMS
ncbi:hypothetical protein SK128_018142, partial [Halocaridina rubra]